MTEIEGFGLFDEPEPIAKPEAVAEVPELKPRKYLVFSLEQERFAFPLGSAREVIEVPEYRSVPNTVPYFLGYFNLRGEVVGLLDLKKKFAFAANNSQQKSAIVFEGANGTLAALVDRIDSLVVFQPDEIDQQPRIKSKIPQEYLLGISKRKELNVIFIDLAKILTEDDWSKIAKS